MANEQQYYSPIIQAMMESVRAQQGQQQLQQAKEQQKALEQFREQQLAQEMKKMDIEHEYNLGHLDILNKQLQNQAEMQKLEKVKGLQSAALEGTNLSQLPPDVLGRMNPGAFQTQNQALQFLQNKAKATATGQAEGQLPSELQLLGAKAQNERSLKEFEQNWESGENAKKIQAEMERTKLTTDTQKQLENVRAGVQLHLGQMQYQPTPEATNAMVHAFATGQATPNWANPQERVAATAMGQMGFRIPSKDDISTLKQSQMLSPLMDKLETFANKLPESKLGAFAQGHAVAGAAAIGFPTDTMTKIQEINSQALNLGRALEGMTGGRVPIKQLELDLGALTSPGITKDQALSHIQNIRDMYVNKTQNMIMGGMNPAQKELIQNTYGVKEPAAPGVIKRVNPNNGHTIRSEDGGKTWLDDKTGQQLQVINQ